MSDINSGNVVRFVNGGSILIGSDPIVNLGAGSMRFKLAKRQVWEHKDQGVISDVYEGDDMAGEFDLDVKVATGTLTGANGILAKLNGAGASGKAFKFTVKVRIPAYRGATAGEDVTLTNCYLPEGPEYQSSADADSDTLRLRGKYIGGHTIAAYP